MSGARFRLWLGDREASADDLARVEEIEVTQEVDRFWEARLKMTMCLDAQGRWQHRPDEVAASAFTRVRIELDPGDGRFVALIDGPIASFDSQLDSQPGRSTATFVVRDDSVFLHREEANEVYENRRDSELADELLRSVPQIVRANVNPPTEGTHENTTRRGTVLDFLGRLARSNDRRVYVLPGEERGQSIGCFLPDPTEPEAGWSPLRLIGAQRNLGDATITEDSESPERSSASTLRLSDGSLASFETGAVALGISGDRPAVPDEDAALRQLPPDEALREDPAPAAGARARSAAQAYTLSSRVVPGCYAAVLMPYRRVTVECGSTPYSGHYLLTKVVHRITPHLWTQEFEATSDGSTEVSSAPVAEIAGGGLSLSFSASVGVF